MRPRLLATLVVASLSLAGAGQAPASDEPPVFFGTNGFAAIWPVSQGQGVTVAVLDSGVSAAAVKQLWTNPGEVANNGLDDDHNGYSDDVHGVDMVYGRDPSNDVYGHGTAVASIIAGQPSDWLDPIAPATEIMTVKVLSNQGPGTVSALIAGLEYASKMGADIINLSLNADSDSPALASAIARARARGSLIVAAAGNRGRNLDEVGSWPASYDGVVAVASLARDGRLAATSNYGRTSVDLATYGEELPSLSPTLVPQLFSGTSAAAPLVSGSLALLRALAPQQSDLDGLLLASASKTSVAVAAGELNPGAAARRLRPLPAGATLGPNRLTVSLKRLGGHRYRLSSKAQGSGRVRVQLQRLRHQRWTNGRSLWLDIGQQSRLLRLSKGHWRARATLLFAGQVLAQAQTKPRSPSQRSSTVVRPA